MKTAHLPAGDVIWYGHVALFAGMAPVENPKVVVVVVIYEPYLEYKGDDIPAPLFSKVLESALHEI